jgi:hypothetical protein
MRKKPTIESLALMCAEEFSAIRRNMATKDELASVQEGLQREMRERFAAMDDRFSAVLHVLKNLREDFAALQRVDAAGDAAVVALRARVERLEKKVGLRK